MDTAVRLLLLPDRDDSPAIDLRIDGDGRILARHVVDAGEVSPPAHPGARQVLAVPGSGCRALWLRLPARNRVQALAAARALAVEQLAVPPESLHLAIAPLPSPDHDRLVVAVDPARMQAWLERAAALGMSPGVVVPMPLLLAAPGAAGGDADDDACIVGTFDGQWLACGARLAFAGEPALAGHVVGERPHRRMNAAATEAMLATGALSPPIDLLQYAFATEAPRREGWPAWRRAAILAAVAAASPLLLLAVQALQHERAARDLQARAHALALEVLPGLAAGADPLPAVRARLSGLEAGDRFAHVTGALLSAVASVDGAELDALGYADGNATATLVLAAPGGLERIRGALADAGLDLRETGTASAGDRVRHDVAIGPAP